MEMRFYSYEIQENSIGGYTGEASETPADFHHYTDNSFGFGEIHYKAENQVVTKVICSAPNEVIARKAVQEFLSTLS